MCLNILKKKHRNLLSGKCSPIRLKKDLLVWKLLTKTNDGNYVTAYQGDTVKFIDGKAILLPISEWNFALTEISETTKKVSKSHHAYHAYTTEKMAKYNASGSNKILKAVIPAGSLVYYGENYDVCSNQMTILL